MRRFRLKSDSLDDLPLIKGCIYNEDCHPEKWEHNVLWNAENNPEAWQEVFDEPSIKGNLDINHTPKFDEPKPLHKDTDLGWAVSVLLRSGWNIHEVVKDAKELIKQLNEEKND